MPGAAKGFYFNLNDRGIGKYHATKCLLRRQTGSQREPCPPSKYFHRFRTAVAGGVCRAATDFACAAGTLWRGNNKSMRITAKCSALQRLNQKPNLKI